MSSVLNHSILASALLATSACATAQTYRCTVDGKTTFQGTPCEGSKPTVAPAQPQTGNTERDAIRAKAEETRRRHAEERERIQRSFRAPGPSSAELASRVIPELGVTQSQACRAGIAAIMGNDPRYIEVVSEESGITVVSYVRFSDKTRWTYRCQVSGRRLLWASPNGRWRNSKDDGQVSLETDGKTISVRQTHADGSSNFESYSLQWLR